MNEPARLGGFLTHGGTRTHACSRVAEGSQA